ncbi:MAG: superoxide dismutase [Firmicutes bacterium]|jgi:Fe-Mn family superoxide dismutase|nr:superoxide dismutase [Bacillota bacterium]
MIPAVLVVPRGEHKLPPLPYSYDALEPYLSRTQLETHYTKHHSTYVEGLNKAERKTERDWANANDLAFHGSGHILHSIYWTNMRPGGGGEPDEMVAEQLKAAFGSFQQFREEFTRAAEAVRGSGWAVLVWQPQWGRLEILTAARHENLTQWGTIPILVLDMWEHAYYIDYHNRRKDYIQAWWNLVNWADVELRLRCAMPARVPMWAWTTSS